MISEILYHLGSFLGSFISSRKLSSRKCLLGFRTYEILVDQTHNKRRKCVFSKPVFRLIFVSDWWTDRIYSKSRGGLLECCLSNLFVSIWMGKTAAVRLTN